MHRILLCLTISLLFTLALHAQGPVDDLPWQELLEDVTASPADSILTLSLEEAPADSLLPSAQIPEVKEMAPPYMLRAVYKSWRKSHPLQPAVKHRRGSLNRFATRQSDSLRAIINSLPLNKRIDDMLYLYDMRLPVINTGSIPTDSLELFHELVTNEEATDFTSDLPISHWDERYEAQTRNEEQRHLARFNYASADPRRFRYARRNFEVPTAESRTLDSRATVQQTRIADDIDIDFGKNSLEAFGQSIILKADKWHWKGDHSLTMQQTALSSNWYKGGDNNMSVSSEQKFTVTRYDEDSKVTFESVLDLKLSGYYTKADTIHRMRISDNELSLTTKYGYRAWKKWYYSAQLYAKTPVFDFYNANSSVCKTTFLSPLEMNLALGVDYQYTSPHKAFTYSLLLAPLSYDMKAVFDHRVKVTQFGIKEGDKSIHNFGSTLTTKFDWKMGPNASWSSRLYYFTTYHAMKVEFENTFNFRISRFFTAKIYAYPRFEDDRDGELEIKEMLTVGFSYQW